MEIHNLILLGVSLLLWSIVFHELGHLLIFYQKLKRFPDVRIIFKPLTIKIGYLADYYHLKDHELKILSLVGIFFGLIPLTFSTIFIHNAIFHLIIIILYLLGCSTDFKILFSQPQRGELG